MHKILIVPIGTVDPHLVRDIAHAVREIFHCDADLGGEVPIPSDAYNQQRNQYHSSVVLESVRLHKPHDIDRLLGVIDKDLYVPELNFVFGEAKRATGLTVISLTRLRQEFYGLPADPDLLHLRSIKEAIHELGHTYGLDHCRDPHCIMRFSNSLGDTDRKGPGFCGDCTNRLPLRESAPHTERTEKTEKYATYKPNT